MTVAGTLLGSGCATAPYGPQNTYTGREGAAELQRDIGNSELDHHVELRDIHSERRDGRLLVQFELNSDLSSASSIEWMVEWYDDKNFLIDVPRHWEPVVIGPRGHHSCTIIGPTTSASAWKLSVRPRNEVK
jgi:hypothetical protein